jgi:hypothetical protein
LTKVGHRERLNEKTPRIFKNLGDAIVRSYKNDNYKEQSSMIDLDLVGKRFGRLLVTEYAFSNKNKKFWKCKCECGESIVTFTAQLNSGKTKSCGCLHRDVVRKLPFGESSFNKLYRSYEKQAKKRNLPFNLTPERFREFTKGACYYCGKEPAMVWKEKGQLWGEYTYNGVDRLDSSQGYESSNCVSCCKTHNRMKSDMSLKEFVEACRQVINHLT